SADPCNNYTVLDDPWRAVDYKYLSVTHCDNGLSGWYRFLLNGSNAQIPDTCVDRYSCSTVNGYWLRGGHPSEADGIVSRDACSKFYTDCCFYGVYPVKVKACPGGFYVYNLLNIGCDAAYCAVTSTRTSATAVNVSVPEGCSGQSSACLGNILDQIENITATVLPVNNVTNILTMVLKASEMVSEPTSGNQAALGTRLLKNSEKLISTLVKPTDTSDSVSFTLPAVGFFLLNMSWRWIANHYNAFHQQCADLHHYKRQPDSQTPVVSKMPAYTSNNLVLEGKVFMVGPDVALKEIPRLENNKSSMDIDLIGIAKKSPERSAAVAFLSYSSMDNLLKPEFFNTSNETIKTMMSSVISATLPKTSYTQLTKPVNFTLRHIRELDSSGSLSCVYWNVSEWIVDGCSVLESTAESTVCSCVHLSTFALIMQTSPSAEDDPLKELVNLVCVIVGLVSFTLALLTFALCQWGPGVNNVARINICISLLLAHLLFLLTQRFLSLIQPQQVLCTMISGLLHFLFLSGFIWMFIEAILLYICVKNLSKISSKKREVLSSGFLCVIGYTVALVVVSVSIGLVPEGYGSKHCWIKTEEGFIWSFLGPVCVILGLNTILFIAIVVILNSTLKNLNAEVSQMKQTKTMVFKTLAQMVVLGCPWALGFFTNVNTMLEIIFLVLNSQQGTFIFLIYCVLNKEIRQQYRRCFRCVLKKD
ncbi:hypothetical protein DNTS_017206, partial [Danionella cerebrum]